jgi:translation initiation factor IF-1
MLKAGANSVGIRSLFLALITLALLLLQGLNASLVTTGLIGGISEYSLHSSYVRTEGSFIIIGNNYVEITITLGNNTGGGIYSIKDKLRGVDFVRNKEYVNIGLFALEYWYDPINWYAALLGRNAHLEYTYSVDDVGATINLYWSDLTSTHEWRKFSVKVHVEVFVPSNSSLTYWHIEFENDDEVTIENVFFPIIVGMDQISDEGDGDYLVFPGWSGALFKNPIRNMVRGGSIGSDYPSGFLNMQFIAYYSSNPRSGLYLANYDETGTYLKRFTFGTSPNDNNVQLSNTHVIPIAEGRSRFSLPYRVVLGVFSGDWYDVAQIYKEWASKQWWARGNLTVGKDTPLWLKKSGAVIDFFTRYWERYSTKWNGPYSNMPPTAETFKRFYNATPVLWWRGWEKNGFGMTPLDYFPPTEGWVSFDAAVQGAHRNGGRVMVPVPYILTHSFNASGWEEVVNYAPRDRWGNLYTQVWYIHNNSGVVVKQVGFAVAPTDFWLSKILNITLELTKHGIDVIQLDGGPPPPFINYHGTLPKGGGSWWASEYLRIYRTVREEIRKVNPEVAIGSEWLVEGYIPYIDLAGDEVIGGLDPRGIAPQIFYNSSLNSYIPLWQAVYHEHMLLFSSLLIIDGRDSLYYLRNLALSLVWGDAPMVDVDPQGKGRPYNLDLYDQRILEYSRVVMEARSKYAYHYLVEGAMLKPPKVSPNPRILVPGASHIPYTGVDVEPFYSDSVFTSAWLASDGSVGVVATSIAPHRLNITIPMGDYGVFREEDLTMYVIVNGVINSTSHTRGVPQEIRLELAPYDVVLVVISPSDSTRARAVQKLQETVSASKALIPSGSSVVDKWLSLATFKFKDNDFEESLSISERLMENLTSLSTIMGEIRALSDTVVRGYNNASTQALRGMLYSVEELLEEAETHALNFNFTASKVLINSSKQKLNSFHATLTQTIEVQNNLSELIQALTAINETVTTHKAKQTLNVASQLLQEASELIEQGRLEESAQLLHEAKLRIEAAKTLEQAIRESGSSTYTTTTLTTVTIEKTIEVTLTSTSTIHQRIPEWDMTIGLSLALLTAGIVIVLLKAKKREP